MALAHYQGYVENVSTGKALEGAVIRVYSYPGNILQSTFADPSSTPKPVVSSDANGAFNFYIPDGFYDLEYVYNGDVLTRLVNIPIYNPANALPAADLGAFGEVLVANATAADARADLGVNSAAELAASGGAEFVGFSHANTYAVGTIGAYLANASYVTDAPYNALGNDSNDDTAEIQACLNADLYVKFPNGTFRISDALTLRDNQIVELSPGTTIRQMDATKNVFLATSKTGITIDLAGGTLRGAGGWSSGWTGNQSHENVRGIQLWGCTRPKILGPGRIYNFGNAGIGINGGTGYLIEPIQIEGTHTHGQALVADNNFQNGIYIANDATYGRADAGTIIAPDISGVAQGILREMPTATNQPITTTLIIGGVIHDIPGQHGVYNQAGKLNATGMAFERCNTSGFKTQSADANQDLYDVSAVGITGDDLGGSLFELATIGTGSIQNSNFQGTGHNVGYLASLNGEMSGINVDIAGDISANAAIIIGASVNATMKVNATNVEGVGIICTATGSNITIDATLNNVNTANTGGTGVGVLGTYAGGADDPAGAATTVRLRSPVIKSPNGFMANAIKTGRTQTTIIVEGDATFANATSTEQFVDTLGTIRSSVPRSWTPACTASSGSLTTTTINNAKYRQVGKSLFVTLDITLTDAGTGTGNLYIPLPVNAISAASLSAMENVATGAIMRAAIRPGDLTKIDLTDSAGNNAIATGRRFLITGEYQWSA